MIRVATNMQNTEEVVDAIMLSLKRPIKIIFGLQIINVVSNPVEKCPKHPMC